MTHETLIGMFHHYYDVRAGLESARTNMPDPEALRLETSDCNPVKARDAQEYRKAFVGDVGIYLKKIEWHERYIMLARMVKPGEEQVGWTRIIRRLNRIGKPFPKSLKDISNLRNAYRDRIKPHAEAYFRERGYLR